MGDEAPQLLTGEAILAADDLAYEDVDVPEWGGTVRIRAMTGRERDRFEMGMALVRKSDDLDVVDIRGRAVAGCCIDADGKRLFADKELSRLAGKNALVLDRLFSVVDRLSGLDVASKQAQEDRVEDFGGTPGDDSSTV